MTKAQRIKLYKQAIKDYTNEKDYNSTFAGLCYYFFSVHGVNDIYLHLPELAKQEPKKRGIGFYWWPRGYKEYRIQALQKALQLAEKK